MPTTTNFGWTTPADTDLVKDGAAAIRTLGNGIDTSFLDLKGGTTGQNLRKNSNTDLDFTWAGDATNTVVDAEGDLLVGDAADTLQRLAIGTTGQVLTVDTTIDGKIKWATAAAPSLSFVGASAYFSTNQSISSGTFTAVTWDVENYDTDSIHSTSTNTSRFTIPTGKSGYWRFTSQIRWANNSSGGRYLQIAKNGTGLVYTENEADTRAFTQSITKTLSLTAGDYLELFVLQTSGGSLNIENDQVYIFAEIVYLGA